MLLTRHLDRVRRSFQIWVMDRQKGDGVKFNENQMTWIRVICNQLMISFHIERDDLDTVPIDRQGSLVRMYQLFGDEAVEG